jgi:membrane protease YdiL (CAAX protease family)
MRPQAAGPTGPWRGLRGVGALSTEVIPMFSSYQSTRFLLPTLGAAFVVVGLLLLDVLPAIGYAAAIAGIGLILALAGALLTRTAKIDLAWLRSRADRADLAVIVGLYTAVVAGLWLAFVIFTTDNVLGLFLSYGTALVVGVAGPVFYTVWVRRRPLASLGLTLGDWRATVVLAVVFAGVQFFLTLARVEYPAPEVWLPLLAMALPVGLFEAVFFRGFIQNRLEASFGLVPAVAVAAGLYGLYHIGYGMGLDEVVFLAGLGIVYGVAFRVAGSILVLWPLLTPLGSLFTQIQAGDRVMPMESILGFADVLGLMVAAIWFARRHERRGAAERTTADDDGRRIHAGFGMPPTR